MFLAGTLNVDEFHKMGAAGVFRHDERVELIEGELIEMAPIGGPHMWLVNLLARMLDRQVGDQALVSIQNPSSLPPDNEPQPDLSLLSGGYWTERKKEIPQAADVLLVIEVADSTLAYDRDTKIPIYGRHGIAEAWLVDVQAETLSLYRDPWPNGYRRLLTPQRSETIAPLAFPQVRIRLSDVWR